MSIVVLMLVFGGSYAMMRRCWELAPEDRPTFKEVYTNISSYIEHMAGYLEMGFNPFSAVRWLIVQREEWRMRLSAV